MTAQSFQPRTGPSTEPHRLPRTFRARSAWRLVVALVAATIGCSNPGDGKTYVLVHGSWMGSGGWGPVAARLRDEGAAVHTLELPAHGNDATPAAAATLAGYVDRVSAEIDTAGTQVILVGHSMAGIVISELAERRPADIATLVYLAAYVPTTGQSLLDLAMTDADSQIGPHLIFHADHTVGIEAAAFADLFCADCSPTARAVLEAGYQAEPDRPLGTPLALTAARFGTVAKAYIHTAQDRVVSPSLQARMTSATAMTREVTLDTSHVPMLASPELVTDALLAQ